MGAIISEKRLSRDPWSAQEEAKMVRKIDKRVLAFLGVMYLFAFFARVNVGNAKIANTETNESMLHSLNMDMAQFSFSISLFFIPYVIFEIPSNILLKSSKPSRNFAIICLTWGIVATFSLFLRDFTGFATTRVILGIAESGLVPGSVYFLSLWYKPKEQGLRYVLFFSAATVASSFGGLLAFAISQLNGVCGMKGWQWIFLLEGFPSIIIAVLCYKYLPDSPGLAYFFTEKERFIATKRIQTKIDSSVFNLKECLIGLFHPRTLIFGVMGFCTCTPMYSFSFLMPTLISNLGYASLTAQLLSSPPFLFGYFFSISFAWHSDKTERKFHLAAIFFGYMTCFILMNILEGMAKYFVIIICVCCAISGLPVLLAWHNEVLGRASKTTKAATSGMLISLSNMGGVISSLIYKDETFGNIVNACLGGTAIICVILISLYVKFRKNDAETEVPQKKEIA